MSTSTEATIRLDVASYVDEVRRHLADLTAEEREELTGGLEADLTERLEESRASGDLHAVLGEPRRYAEELRAAAGLSPTGTSRAVQWSAAVERLRGWSSASGWPQNTIAWDFLVSLRPVWWVLRAWIAVQALDYWFGDRPHDWIPSVGGQFGGRLAGVLLLLGASVVSVQIGRRQWWPAAWSTGWPHALLIAANVLAVAMIPEIVSRLPTSREVTRAGWSSYSVSRPAPQGVRLNGDPVRNIYAYDADGRALLGVQLFNQDGDPLAVASKAQCCPRNYLVTYPWGLTEASDGLRNVYPLATREQPRRELVTDAFTDADPPMVPAPPFVQVPAVADLPPEALEAFYAVTGTEPAEEPSEDKPDDTSKTPTEEPAEDEADDTGTDKPQREDTKRQVDNKRGEGEGRDRPGTDGDGRERPRPGD